MIDWLRALLFAPTAPPRPPAPPPPPPTELSVDGATFEVARHLVQTDGLPSLDWAAAGAWTEAFTDAATQWRAWDACRAAWLAHLGASLDATTPRDDGRHHRVTEFEGDMLLSTLPAEDADALLGRIAETRGTIVELLDGIANLPQGGGATVIAFDDHDAYYRYVARFYPDEGEFAFSSGMQIAGGCPHFVFIRSDLQSLDHVVAHELTHACLSHLPLPAWLNEGLAVITERELCGAPPSLHSPQELHAMHVEFWDEASLQEFWNGRSFLRSDEGNLLSYDLARILVDGMSLDREAFAAFTNAADLADGGRDAARAHLGLDLGEAVASLLGHEPSDRFGPRPVLWESAPERGAFRAARLNR